MTITTETGALREPMTSCSRVAMCNDHFSGSDTPARTWPMSVLFIIVIIVRMRYNGEMAETTIFGIFRIYDVPRLSTR